MIARNTSRESVLAGIYVRISDDREGRELGVQRQEEDCRKLADRLGWRVVDVYADNDISAFSGKERPGYERLLGDVETGRINAILAWHNDRLHRSPLELEHFITVVNTYGVQIQTDRAGELDLSTSSGRMIARQHGIYARYESEQKSDRIRRKVQQLVEEGKVHNGGPRPYGYTRIYAGEGPRRKILRDEINEHEAAVIRECAERLLSGDTLRSIVGDLNQRGLTSSQGNSWSMQALRGMLRSGRIAGLKEHKRQVVGPASWAAIVDKETHQQLRALLDSKGRHPGQGPRKYYLTGLVYCDCNEDKPIRMKVGKGHGKLKYTCPPKVEGGCGGRVIGLGDLTKLVDKWIIGRASDNRVLQRIAERSAASQSETKTVIDAIEKDERRLALLQGQLTDEEDDELIEVVVAVKKIRGRIRENRNRLAQLAGATPLIGVDIAELAERWNKDLGLDRKRALAQFLIERIVIHPTPIRGRFDPDRVDIQRRP